MFEQYSTLLITKLYAPRPRSAHLVRPHLLAALDAGLDRKLILVAAAAGFGKTTLLAEWSSQRMDDDVCWVSLDEGDNDPVRFLSYLTAAIQLRRPQVGVELLAALQSPQPPMVDNALRALINQVASVPQRLILILDDYHAIENSAVHAAVTFLLDYLPPQMTLILLTRADPPLPLARLRAKNDLLEVRADALRFSEGEAYEFLNRIMRLSLPQEAISALESRTEGWIVGLQLAAVAMQSLAGDQQAFVQDFTGSHRFVLDYLVEEVLARQPDNVRRFLLETSILHRLNGGLCSAVTGVGQEMIDYLERNNLFIIPLDQSRHWYRYHHLFADLLQARLQAEYTPVAVRELRQRAARWLEQNGLLEEAIDYALAAEDYEHAARLILAANINRRGEVITLLKWYRAFPPDCVTRHPRLALQFGQVFALSGRWSEAEALLQTVEQSGGLPDGDSLLLAYLVASYRQDTASLDAVLKAAQAISYPDAVTLLVMGLLTGLKGDFQAACRLMANAQVISEREGDYPTALTALFHLCRMQVFRGNLKEAHALCHQALQRIDDIGGAAQPMAAFAHTALGRIGVEWDDLNAAVYHLTEAIRIADLSGFVMGTLSSATMMLAEAQRDAGSAVHTAQTALAYSERFDPPYEAFWLKTYLARLWLAQGNVAAASDWLNEYRTQNFPVSLLYPNRIQKVTAARVLLAQRKVSEAISVLTRLAAEPQDLLTVEVLAALALARHLHGDSVLALLTLEQALTLAEAENRVRVFLDFGPALHKLLARFCETHPENRFARRLLPAEPVSPPPSALTERELEILRLIAAGYSNEEIAQTLTLAVSTVKWYINALYSKLQVKSRGQAIARAHELHLLTE